MLKETLLANIASDEVWRNAIMVSIFIFIFEKKRQSDLIQREIRVQSIA